MKTTLPYATLTRPPRWMHTGSAALLVSALGNLLAAALVVHTLWNVPTGTRIRPLNLVMYEMVMAVLTAAVALPLGILAISVRQHGRRHWFSGLLAIALAAMPFVTFSVALRAIMQWRGLVDAG
ncbi:hypothetical protein [Fontivita pretiosa]|uniref:hypothetical protein n=1 Tax=Fontivita pretiosa TaxID=2989684 RepID=UPI003D17FCA5